MSNTLITSSIVARDASIILADIMVAASLINRNQEDKFAKKVGDTVEVKVPPVFSARDLNDDGGTTTASDVTETSVDLTLEKWPYLKVDLTSKEQTLEVDDFNELVVKPAMISIMDAIDEYIIDVLAAGFAPNLVGEDGTSPATIAQILAGRKELQDNKCPPALRRALIDTTAEASFLQLNQFTSRDYGEDSTNGLREARINRRFGIDWYASQNCGTLAIGTDIAGTVLTNGDPVLAASTLAVDGFTAATGTVKRGTRFTVAGDTTVYTVTADATIATNAATLSISPVVTADLVAAGDGAALTFKSALTENMIFHRDAATCAIVPPNPLMGADSSVKFSEGVGIRVTMDGATTNMASSIVFDTFVGAQVVQVAAGTVFQGSSS